MAFRGEYLGEIQPEYARDTIYRMNEGMKEKVDCST